MTISERMLRKWRKEALIVVQTLSVTYDKLEYPDTSNSIGPGHSHKLSERILRMTQELLDQHLLRKSKGK